MNYVGLRGNDFNKEVIESIRKGENICLYGKGGEGKTTLAKSIISLEEFKEVILIDGYNGEKERLNKVLRKNKQVIVITNRKEIALDLGLKIFEMTK